MIILDERNFLNPELISKGFEIFDYYEGVKVLSINDFCSLELKRRADFLLVDTESLLRHPELLEQFKTILNTFMGAVFFHDHSNAKAQDWVKNEGAFLSKIIGEYALPMTQLSWTILTNQLQFFWTLIEDQRKLQRHIAEFSVELDQVLQNAESEMFKAKKIYETFVPRKSEEIKGVHFTNKYAVGDGGGVEFYDLIQAGGKVYHVLLSTQSYLISSALLGILSQEKEKGFNPDSFLKDASAEVETINQAKKKKSEADILILEMDLGTLVATAKSNSKAELYGQESGRVSLTKGTSHHMQKGEKVIVLSPGFLFNWNEGHPQKKLQDYLSQNKNLGTHELMSELFFQLKDNKSEKMLQKDATVFMMEVNRHGIHKV